MVSVSSAAERLGVSRDTVLRYIEAGTLTGYRFTERGWWRVTKSSIDSLERSMREQIGEQ